ncbi:MAG: antibiotic biosynthesis monooxygenase [Sphingomonas sp. 28-62-20]|uniref:putative quinol monooxygenase n=1 Tax=unclassified Sphingomonas TaxID=196159 RepID=UPI000BD686E2|nr:antibiotic biosynthesis monooxygenase [Sphingomonas sp.]OYY77003.1 MAG: antibiotic biosynthesis monooxygenase [Sphingomonas sp. 28-62-20]
MIIVTGTATARPDSFEALLQASLDHVQRSRAEDGCISHAVQIDAEDPLTLVFFERWRDMAALQLHFRQPGSAEFMDAIKAYAARPGTLDLYTASPIER